ncbi:MAG: hypothetical protein HY748_09045 [Elusimicrobia bacterium]|nr:hypothetical protein [Elusimicrobiota bacterium]
MQLDELGPLLGFDEPAFQRNDLFGLFVDPLDERFALVLFCGLHAPALLCLLVGLGLGTLQGLLSLGQPSFEHEALVRRLLMLAPQASGFLAERRLVGDGQVGALGVFPGLGELVLEVHGPVHHLLMLGPPLGQFMGQDGSLALPGLFPECLAVGEEALLAFEPELDLILDLLAEDLDLVVQLGALLVVEGLEMGLPVGQYLLLAAQSGLHLVDLHDLGGELLLQGLPAPAEGFLRLERRLPALLLGLGPEGLVLLLQFVALDRVVALEVLLPLDQVLVHPGDLSLVLGQGLHVELARELEVHQALELLVVELALGGFLGVGRDGPPQGLAFPLYGRAGALLLAGLLGGLGAQTLDGADALQGPAQGHAGGVEVVDGVDVRRPGLLVVLVARPILLFHLDPVMRIVTTDLSVSRAC